MTNIYAALEIGTSNTVLAIGESENGGELRISTLAEIPSTGIRKSKIVNVNMATQSIRSVLRQIESKQAENGATITVGNAFLLVSGQHVDTTPRTGNTALGGARVTDDDVSAVIDDADDMDLPNTRELLDIVHQDYMIDTNGGIQSPVGMTGGVLSLNALHIHADRNSVQDARTAAESAHLEIREPLFATTCAADAVLEEHEKKNGVLVLDMGGGSTGYAAYMDGYLVTTGVIGVGGDHVTNDISYAFQTTLAQSEAIKVQASSAVLSSIATEDERVKIPGSSTLLDSRTISRRSLDTVVNARLRELMAMIREKLEEKGLLSRLHKGTVLTGGGAAQKGLDLLVQRELGTPVRFGKPLHVSGLEKAAFPARYAAIAGALLYANSTCEKQSTIVRIFKDIFT